MSSSDSVSFIYNFSNGFAIRRGFDVWLYLAYSSFLISYFISNILYIRIVLTLGNCFFVIWSFLAEGLGVQLDTTIFNLVFILINTYQIIRLIRKMLPPKFSPFETNIYERDFAEVFSTNEFKMLINHGTLEYLSQNESQICKVGQSFKEIIYIAQLNEGFELYLLDRNDNIISRLSEGSWIGIGEYAIREDYMKNPKIREEILSGQYEVTWGVSGLLRQVKEENKEFDEKGEQRRNSERIYIETQNEKLINEKKDVYIKSERSDNLMLKKRSEGCIVYRFSLEVSNSILII